MEKTHIVLKVQAEYGNMINVRTNMGELRLIFQPDGSFRLITDLKNTNIQTVLDKARENRDLAEYTRIVECESFSYPED